VIAPLHTKHDRAEIHKQADCRSIECAVYSPSDGLAHLLCEPVHAEHHGQNSKEQRWVVMVHIRDTSHQDEREVVEEPADYRVDTAVHDVFHIFPLKLIVPPLPSHSIPGHDQGNNTNGRGRAPINKRVTEEEVFRDVVIPATHTQADVKNGPLPEGRGEVVLFVWVGDEGVVGGHHCNVEVYEVSKEG